MFLDQSQMVWWLGLFERALPKRGPCIQLASGLKVVILEAITIVFLSTFP
jgi:hypothetical protein